MADIDQSEASPPGEQPGKVRTWWHPLLARMLDFVLSSGYSVQAEVSVGKMPLRVDILLIRREGGQLSEARIEEVSALVPLLNKFTLIEFKGPTDSLERGDFSQLAGCAFLWHSQQNEPIASKDVTLIVLAPKVSRGLSDELQLFGCECIEHGPGIISVSGLPFTTWLVETDVMAALGQPVLSLVSRVFLKDRESIIKELERKGHTVLLRYWVQQVFEYRSSRKDFAMQPGATDELALADELLEKILAYVPLEERLRGVPTEDRVRGISLEEFAAALSAEEAAQLRELLEKKRVEKK